MTERELRGLHRNELIEKLISRDRIIAGLRGKTERLESLNTDLMSQIDELKSTLERLKKKLDLKDAEMESTYDRLTAKLDAKDAEMESTFNRLKAKLDAKDAELERLNDQLEETYKRLAHKLDIKDNRIRELKTILLQRTPETDIVTSTLNAPNTAEDFDRLPEDAKPAVVRVRKKKSTAKVKKKPVKAHGKR